MSKTFETERLILRRWKTSDRGPFHQLNSDPAVMEFLPGVLSRQESDAMIARAEEHFEIHGFGWWALEAKDGGAFIGFTGLAIPKFETHFTPCVEVGWRLVRSKWGKGYATEAARAAITFGFNTLNLQEIVSFTVPMNLRSIAVMERLRMKRDVDGDFEHPKLPIGDRLRSHILYRLNKRDSKFSESR